MKNFQPLLSCRLEELSIEELGLMLERDPTSDSYRIYARESCLDPIRKDRLAFNS